jgi:multicomponent Na+:H+ antiporter subunit G
MILTVIGILFLSFGALFLFFGGLGLFRMPDVFNKLQAGTKATTLGFISVAVGVLFLKPEWFLKIILILALILLTNPIGSHALARASKDTGIKIYQKDKSDGEEQ